MLVNESNNTELNTLLEALFSQIDDLNDQYEHVLNLFQEMVKSLPANPR